MEKYISYLNTVLLAVLLGIIGFSGKSAIQQLGAASVLPTASQFYDIQLDSSNGIGSASLYVNSRIAVASSASGVTFTGDVFSATTSLASAGTLSVTGVSTFTGSSTFKGGLFITSTVVDTVGICGTSPVITGANGIGIATMGTDASSTCTVTFGRAFSSAPSCTVSLAVATSSELNTAAITSTPTTLRVTYPSSTNMLSARIHYQCFGL